ncbi:MAG: hypothetical protein C4523_11225 [Myxococcales bacterium]|nr:MAG: hypothetical protein C4523_11225 [Myxococcales bacterium]
MDNSLQSLVRGYLESTGFKILQQEGTHLIADRLVFGQDRDTIIVWSLPPDLDASRYETSLLASISTVRPNYPDAKAYVLSQSRGGFSRDLLQALSESRIKFLVPIQFFDAAFKVEEAPKAASAIADIRSLAAVQRRVQQPFQTDGVSPDAEIDLFDTLHTELTKAQGATVRIVVGRAGIGKSFLFRALFARLYDEFLAAKAHHGARSRPIPLLPEHMKGTYALRTEALVDNFLRTDVASPVARETFEWLLVNGFATWLLDGLDELYAGDPYFFEYLADLVTRKESKAQITIWCRDSLLTTSDAFAEFRDLCSGSTTLKIYRLSDWERPSKRRFAWLGLEERHPKTGEEDTERIVAFLREIDRTPTLRALSGLPFYCELLLKEYRDGHLNDFGDEVTMLNFVVDQMVKREVEKGLLDIRLFETDGLNEWLEQIAVNYVEGQRYSDIDRDEAKQYGELVLHSGLDEKEKDHILTSLLQFPLFRAGAETGLIAFTHDLIAEALAARAYLRALRRQPVDVGQRLSRVDLEDPTLLRFMASRLRSEEERKIIDELRRGTLQGRGLAALLSLLMLARPERDLVKQIHIDLEAQDLVAIRFRGRDLSGISFRRADLSHAVFQDCDLRNAHFEGAFLNQTKFEGDNKLEGADFGDCSRVESVWAGRRLIEDPSQIGEWISRVSERPLVPGDPCPTALQIAHLFGKFITPLGEPRRDDLRFCGLVAGKRYSGAASSEACINELLGHGYLTGPDYRERYRRAEGDKYAEMVRFACNGNVSNGLGRVIASLCRRRGCMHQLRS